MIIIEKSFIILIFNFSFLIINILFFLVFKNGKKENFFFKNSDEFIFFQQKYFTKHYLNHNNYYNDSNKKKNVSLICKDTLDNNNCVFSFKKILENLNFIVEIDEEKPDFLIYDVFGCEHSKEKYNKSVKIAFYSENIIADFSNADYCLSQAHLIYLDRYFKYPSFIWRLNYLRDYKVKSIGFFAKNKVKSKFCAAVISNVENYTSFRLEFIKHLNKYKQVDMGGEYQNNVGGKVKDKIKFLSSYKFSISMENSNGDGYITEKIIDSLMAGTIPIYYGDYLIDEYINPKVYINIKGEKDIFDKIDYIKKIDNDDKMYKSILNEKIFINDYYIDIIRKTENERSSFLHHIFLQNPINAKRIDDINIKYNCEL